MGDQRRSVTATSDCHRCRATRPDVRRSPGVAGRHRRAIDHADVFVIGRIGSCVARRGLHQARRRDERRRHRQLRPVSKPRGVRCTFQDFMASVIGRRPDGAAHLVYDSVGVQYGLKALEAGLISVDQFVDVNVRAGGYDRDGRWQPARSRVDPDVAARLYRTGHVTQGRASPASPSSRFVAPTTTTTTIRIGRLSIVRVSWQPTVTRTITSTGSLLRER